jgi:hypothetical protein
MAPKSKENGRPIRHKDVLRLSKRAPLRYALVAERDGRPSFSLFLGAKEVTVSEEWVPFMQSLVRQERFVAESAMRWAPAGMRYRWDDVRGNLKALLHQAILEREDEAAPRRTP